MKHYFIVIDTNVLVSGLISRNQTSPPVGILNYLFIERGVIIPLFNDEIIKEYETVLKRDKFNIDHKLVDDVIDRIKTIGVSCERIESKEIFKDAKDIVFYEVALSKEGAYLVTGNLKHFPKKPIVVTPSEMIQILEDNGLIEKEDLP